MTVATRYPTGDSTPLEWTTSSGSTHYSLIDETPMSTSDYIQSVHTYSEETGHTYPVDVFTFGAISNIDTISEIKVYVEAEHQDGGTNISGNIYMDGEWKTAQDFGTKMWGLEGDSMPYPYGDPDQLGHSHLYSITFTPGGNTWNATDWSNFKVKLTDSANSTDLWNRVYQLYVEVTYTESGGGSQIKKVAGVALASIKKIAGVAIASVKKAAGVANS